MAVIRRQFDVYLFGLIETIKAIPPAIRAQQSGVIVNISSVGGRITYHLGTLYHGSRLLGDPAFFIRSVHGQVADPFLG